MKDSQKRVIVKVIKGNINKALKVFKTKVKVVGILEEVKDRKEYKKPTTVKRKKMQDAKRKQQKINNEEKELN